LNPRRVPSAAIPLRWPRVAVTPEGTSDRDRHNAIERGCF
jgi:hypothetical protein